MLIRLRKAQTGPQRDSILSLCNELGYRVRFLDEARELLELSGEGRPEHRSLFEDLACVAQVLDAGDARELFQLSPQRPGTLVRAAGALFGQGNLSLIGGPCAVEGREPLMRIARAVRDSGATLLRGGAYKPRTSPYSFQGLGEEGLAQLAQVKTEIGIGVVTEVLDPRDVDKVARVCDMFQIGTRSMTNAPLLNEVAQAGLPILLKRGFGARVREFLLAAEFILAQGNEQVVLCERGIRGFDDITRNVLDVGAVAYLKQTTHLPVIVDPSHAAGRADLVRPLARAGIAAGADGLIIEVHPHPERVHSDGTQAVSETAFRQIAEETAELAAIDGRRLVRPLPEAIA